jgi:hypothetical protein
MQNTLILLNADDIPAAVQMAARVPDATVLVFDPVLIDRAAAAGLPAVEFMAWDGAPSYASISDAAHRLAREVGREIDAIAEPVWPGLDLGSWQHLRLYYLHMALLWYGPLFEALSPRLAGRRLLVPLCDQPQSYYAASFVPALMLLLQSQRDSLNSQAFAYGRDAAAPHDTRQLVPHLAGVRAAGGGPFLLTHLPTCFYDLPYINAEIAAAGLPVVDVQARQWSVPVRASTTIATAPLEDMLGELDATQTDRIDTLCAALAAPIERHLGRWLIATAYRERQAALWLATTRAQLVTRALLDRHFAQARPRRLLLSDHDADFHGPLAAWARAQQVPLLVLPHSRTSTHLEFVARNATVLYHPVQGLTVHDVHGARPPQQAIDLPTRMQFDTAVAGTPRRIGLLLNGVALNGVPSADWGGYGSALRPIVDWCHAQGLELLVRSRPGQTLFRHLVETAGLSAAQLAAGSTGTVADFAQACDLCVMYDAPTSAVLECLSRGLPTLNAVSTPFTDRECGSMHIDIVPRADVATTLRQLQRLWADGEELLRFRRRQFAAYVDAYRNASPLRGLL